MDGTTWSAAYEMPKAMSIELGSSGTSIEVRMNEDGSYSYRDGEQWLVVMADTRVTAANGNVYGWRLVNGMPAPDYIAQVVTVMLGELGGPLQLTQNEDMTWSLGDMQVESGYDYTHPSSGNIYKLTLDEAGIWSAVYQQNMVTVALGTQGSVSLAQAEDMSWWLNSEAFESGSEVMSESGNKYVLTYADGAWAAAFQPESLSIKGTGLQVFSREGDDLWDVGAADNGMTLPANGVGDVSDGDAMYHVWMADGGLAGARFDAAIAAGTLDRTEGLMKDPGLSADDTKTVANEQRTHLTYRDAKLSLGTLLGGALASAEGPKVIDEIAKQIRNSRELIRTALDLPTGSASVRNRILTEQWENVQNEVNKLFATGKHIDVRQPDRGDILDDIAEILDALASEDAFVAATKKDGRGVFASTGLGASAARTAFNLRTWEADATMGTTGSTRYGTLVYLQPVDKNEATKGLGKVNAATAESGAYAYSTMPATQRASHVFAPTGVAVYEGSTEALGRSGSTHTRYSGTMALQVRFNSMKVSGLVQDLVDDDGSPWQHNFADVSRIIFADADLNRNASFDGDGLTQIYYTASSGRLRPDTNGPMGTLEGQLLGRGADAGSEASGIWTLGSTDLVGGFGVEHVANVSRPGPANASAGASEAMVVLGGRAFISATAGSFKVASGNLEVRVQPYAWNRADSPAYNSTGVALATRKISLATLEGKSAGEITTVSQPTHVSAVIKTLEGQREILRLLQGSPTPTQAAEVSAWETVKHAVRYQLFGGHLPEDLGKRYKGDTDTSNGDEELRTDAEALELIDRVVEALADESSLKAALNKDTGIFAFVADNPEDEGIDLGSACDKSF